MTGLFPKVIHSPPRTTLSAVRAPPCIGVIVRNGVPGTTRYANCHVVVEH